MSEIGKPETVREVRAVASPLAEVVATVTGGRVARETFASEKDDVGHELKVGHHVHGKDKEGHTVKGTIKSIDEKTHDVVVVDDKNVEHHCNAKDLHDDDVK